MSVGFADWRNLYLLAEICDQQPDWSNLYLLADVCDQQLTPLIPFNFPKRKSNGVVDHRSKHKEETSAASFQTETNPNPPRRFMDRIQQLGGSEVKFLIQKTLSVTDVKKDQNRLSMPFSQIHSDFLTPQERMFLSRKEDDGKHYQGMEVMVIEPCLDQSSLCLKKWDYRSSSFSYVLIKNWYNLVVNNGLQPGMVVQIWSFRVENALCLALVNLS
ncbi:hypothetical protein FEM48_Zijuj07G0164600 [Ziziphus jujuba var. spinosa]|uniref:Uncharacterized protein n=1 Tax=Ziziphus jujuba var. spinosa TaxID=714518 RepID=A0A978V5Q0_ZIZJJ|nr:hypothetical protein FEM48_Zijuj07G0164600 [Ziziphus jujuba var. spinosa]